MTYQICILDSNDIYQVLNSSTDGLAMQAVYSQYISTLFSTLPTPTPNTFTLVSPCMVMDVSTMFATQRNNINAVVPTALSIMLAVCF
jgi:hypothetical protein